MLLFVLAAIIVWNLFGPHADARLDAIRQQGYPVTLAELDSWYKAVPEKQNNALIYEKAFALPGFGNFEDIDWPPRDRDLSVEDKKQLADLVATNGVALRLLHSAQTSKHCRYPVDLNKLLSNGGFPNRFQFFQGVRLLSAEALLHVNRGDSQQAAQSLLSAGLMADSVADEPVLISQIVRVGCWDIIARRMERVIALTRMTDEQLASLQAMVAQAERPEALLRGLAGERAMGITAFNDLRYLFSEPQLSDLLKDRFLIGLSKSTGFFEKDRAFYLDTLEKSVAAASLPFPERLNLGGRIPSRAAAPRFSIITPIVLPGIFDTFASEANTAARLRAAQTALAVERFRRGHGGALPAALQELVPRYCQAVPLDPFDGAPLRFKALDSGCLIYGNGMDPKNGGPLGFRIVWRSDSSNGVAGPSSTAAADNRP